MSRVSRRVRGSFFSLVSDPLPTAAIQTHQIDAAARPRLATSSLTDQLPKRNRRGIEHYINERLSDGSE
jgi:hypothetical protein